MNYWVLDPAGGLSVDTAAQIPDPPKVISPLVQRRWVDGGVAEERDQAHPIV